MSGSGGPPAGAALDHARAVIEQLYAAALKAVDPVLAVSAALASEAGAIVVGGHRVTTPRGVHVVAVGKAAVAMTRGALEVLGGSIVTGDVITKEGHVDARLLAHLRVHEAGHPIPDERGVRATEQALVALSELGSEDVVLALISGGGSALLEAPVAGITLDHLAKTTDVMLRAGAPIEALNAVRGPLSRVKGGGLRAAASAATWVTLILSDVLGNDPRIIASGPTVAERHDPAMAMTTIDRFGTRDAVPAEVIDWLESTVQGSPAPANPADVLLIIGDNATAVAAAAAEARVMGLDVDVIWHAAEGEAAELGRRFVDAIDAAGDGTDALLGGGEATVTVRGDGRGGRNTEFALAAALELEERALHDWVIASLATDGQDALTGAAGAIADAGTVQRARQQGIDAVNTLERNDSMSVFEAAGGLVVTGPTGTNVNDLYIAARVK